MALRSRSSACPPSSAARAASFSSSSTASEASAAAHAGGCPRKVCVCSASPERGRPRVHHLGAPDAGGDRHARGEPLADAQEIRPTPSCSHANQRAGAAEARCRSRRRSAAIPRRRTGRAARARKPSGGTRSPPRPWIGSTITAPIGARHARGRAAHVVDVAEARERGRVREPRRERRAEALAVRRVERADREAVIAAFERDDSRAPRGERRGLQRDLDRVAARGSEHGARGTAARESGARAPRAARP